MEVEGEVVPRDGKNGFYFVNVSADLDATTKKGTVEMQLLHTQRDATPPYKLVCDLGSFEVPASRFKATDKTTGATLSPQEALENEYGFLVDRAHNVLFAGLLLLRKRGK